MLSLRVSSLHDDGATAQPLFEDADAQAGAGQQRRLAPVTEPHALDADVLGEQQRPERSLDEGDLGQRGGEMAAGRRQDRGLAHLAADLDADAGAAAARAAMASERARPPHLETRTLKKSAALLGDERLGVGQRHQRLVGHDWHGGGVPQPRAVAGRTPRQRLLDGGDAERRHRVQDLDRALERPGAVGVEPQRDVGAERLPHGAHARDVVVEADLDLDVAQADRAHLPRVLDGAGDRARRDDAAVRHPRAAAAAGPRRASGRRARSTQSRIASSSAARAACGAIAPAQARVRDERVEPAEVAACGQLAPRHRGPQLSARGDRASSRPSRRSRRDAEPPRRTPPSPPRRGRAPRPSRSQRRSVALWLNASTKGMRSA